MSNPAADFKSLFFVRSLTTDVTRYRIDEQQDGGVWTTIAFVWAAGDEWSYRYTTATLDDLSEYAFRVIPVDAAENACDVPLELGPELMVREPDEPDFDVTFDNDTQRVTFSAG